MLTFRSHKLAALCASWRIVDLSVPMHISPKLYCPFSFRVTSSVRQQLALLTFWSQFGCHLQVVAQFFNSLYVFVVNGMTAFALLENQQRLLFLRNKGQLY